MDGWLDVLTVVTVCPARDYDVEVVGGVVAVLEVGVGVVLDDEEERNAPVCEPRYTGVEFVGA